MAERTAQRTARQFPREYQEIVVALVLLAVMLYLRLGISGHIVGRSGRAFLDPDFWPGSLLTFGILLGFGYLALAVNRALQYRRTGQHAGEAGATLGGKTLGDSDVPGQADEATVVDAEPDKPPSVLGLLASIGLLFAYIYLLPPVGFVVTTVAFCVAFLLFVGERRWVILVAMPLVTTAVVLFVFTRLLVVPLPRGAGFFLQLSTYLY